MPPSHGVGNNSHVRPSPSARIRTVSESGALPYSPLEMPDSMPLWHNSYDRMNSLGDSGNSHRSYMTSQQQQQLLSQSLGHIRFPLHSVHPPQQVRSVPTTPLALSAAPNEFHFPVRNAFNPSLAHDSEGVYESYENRGDVRAVPTQYESLRNAPSYPLQPNHSHQMDSVTLQRQMSGGSALPNDNFNLSASSASTLQQMQQDLNQSTRTATYSPDHYSHIHYPQNSTHPSDIVV